MTDEEHHLRDRAGGGQPGERSRRPCILNKTKADPLFAMIQDDASLTEVKKKEQDGEGRQQAALLKGTKAAASDVRVRRLQRRRAAGRARRRP